MRLDKKFVIQALWERRLAATCPSHGFDCRGETPLPHYEIIFTEDCRRLDKRFDFVQRLRQLLLFCREIGLFFTNVGDHLFRSLA